MVADRSTNYNDNFKKSTIYLCYYDDSADVVFLKEDGRSNISLRQNSISTVVEAKKGE